MELRERVARTIDDLRAIMAIKLLSLAMSLHQEECFNFAVDTTAMIMKTGKRTEALPPSA
jgi:hypothetical protein